MTDRQTVGAVLDDYFEENLFLVHDDEERTKNDLLNHLMEVIMGGQDD